MPPTSTVPQVLKPYVCHGVNLDIYSSPGNVRDLTGVGAVSGDCPWCGREGKLNIVLTGDKAGMWRCVVCNEGSGKGGGNVYTFLRCLHEQSMKITTEQEYKALAISRELLYTDTLRVWGVCKSSIDGTWMVPGYSVQNGTAEGGKLVQLYRYVRLIDPKTKNPYMALLATAGLAHGLHGPDLPTPKGGVQITRRERNGPIYLCEGPWDGMAFWETASRAKRGDQDNLVPTGNPEAALTWTGSVVAVPGCGTFNPAWTTVTAGRSLYTFYDNDHPREGRDKNGKPNGKITQAGLDGTMRVVDILAAASSQPKEVKYCRWGADTYHDTNLSHGYDVRDHLAGPEGNNPQLSRLHALNDLLHRLQPIPQEWLPGRDEGAAATGGMALQYEDCKEWKELHNALRAVLKPTDGIVRTFAAGLASILSVPSIGDQLWLMVIGPPSSAKSTLCELWSANRQFVLPKDTLTGLFSGWQMGLEKDQNLSLAGEMMNKTLVIKDADTVLQSPQCPQIMSQLRALYDRAVRTQYKNRMSKDWEGMNSTVILCGTATLYQLDAAERGARYLTVNIQPHHDYELEDEITLRQAYKAFRNMAVQTTSATSSQDVPEMTRLKQLTAGYIQYLRNNAEALIEKVQDPSGDALKMCGALATFVSYMRCRAPKKQNEKVEREMPYRLTSQLVRLARGLAVVFNKTEMDAEVMGHVRAIGLNTAEGKVLNICDYIRSGGAKGVTSHLAAQALGMTHDEMMDNLRFLQKISAVSFHASVGAIKTRPKWMLAPRLNDLYDRIFGRSVASGATAWGRHAQDDDE